MYKLIAKTDFAGVVPFTPNVTDNNFNVYVTQAQKDFQNTLPPDLFDAIMAMIKAAYLDWNIATAYVAGNYVYVTNAQSEKVLYKCLIGNTGSLPTDVNANWQRIVLFDVWRDYLKPYLIWKAFKELLFWHGYNVTPFGLTQISEEGNESISDKKRADLTAYASSEIQIKWFDFTVYMNEASKTIDSVVYDFADAKVEKIPFKTKIRSI